MPDWGNGSFVIRYVVSDGRKGFTQVPSPEQTSLWLYYEAMPKSHVTADQAAALA